MKKILTLFIVLLLTCPAFAMDKVYVVLGVNHPDYKARQPQIVMSGFVTPEDVKKDFDLSLYDVLTVKPVNAKDHIKLTPSQKLNKLYNKQSAIKRAQYAPLKVAVNLLLGEGDIEAARAVIKHAVLVEQADEPIRKALLEILK